MMKIKPLQDRIVIKRIEEEEKTKGGIIIPDSAKEKPQEGRVVAIGDGKTLESWQEGTIDGEARRQNPLWQVFRDRDQN